MAQIGKFTAASVISVAAAPPPPLYTKPPHLLLCDVAAPALAPSWIGDFAVHCYFENHCKNGLTYKPSLRRFTATKDANLLTKQQQPLQKKNEKKNRILKPRTSFFVHKRTFVQQSAGKLLLNEFRQKTTCQNKNKQLRPSYNLLNSR